jgi:biotin transport system substrate-specific component
MVYGEQMTTLVQQASTSRVERTREMVTAALVTALLAASAWITIPFGVVPVTLQVFFVVLAALLLSPLWAAASVGAYLVLGAAGLPVFAGAQGGLGVIAGPTGGYLVGFLVGAFLGSMVRIRFAPRALRSVADHSAATAIADMMAAAVVIACAYAIGVVQLMLVLDLGLVGALAAGVVPFIVPDAIKAVVAVAAAGTIRRARGE